MEKCSEHSGTCEKINAIDEKVNTMEKNLTKMIENSDKRFNSFQMWLMGIMATTILSLVSVVLGILLK
jgi:predicted nucleic acid-binding Zn ribbon protein